jgi:hypothetical protein
MSETHEIKALAIIPRTITELVSLAELLAKSDLLPKALRGKVADVAMTIMAGQEMGLSPMAALRNFHVIEGKPVMSADGMVAIALGSGLARYFRRVEESDNAVTYETLRVGEDKPKRCTWTKQMAKDAGLNTKDNWRLYPRAMLAARAKAELARDVYPDVLAGCSAQEEVGDWPPPKHEDAIDAEIVSETKVEVTLPDAFDAIEQAGTVDALKGLVAKDGALAAELAKLTREQKAIANERYGARLKWLRENETKEGAA